MSPTVFELPNPTIQRQHIHTFNPSATGIGQYCKTYNKIPVKYPLNIKQEHLDILSFS